MTDNLIRSGDYCTIVSDKFIHEDVKRGHLVYVAGHKALPISETDPYTQRIKFLIHLVDKNGELINKNIYLMDPSSIQKVNKNKQKHLEALALERKDSLN